MLPLFRNNASASQTTAGAAPAPGLGLLIASNHTAAPYPREACIHELFEARVAAAPDSVALAFEERTLTYGEVNRKSNQVAHHLRGLGVRPDDLVAVSLDRSPETIVALLGILKAGGAYLPLDPDAPTARLKLILDDAAPAALVTQRRRLDGLPEYSGHVVLMDDDCAAVARESEANPVCATTAASLAYVLYTSGSTGAPKGVMVEHRPVVRLVCNTDYVRLNREEVLLQMAPLAFDASTFEIWGALLNGAKLAIMPPGTPDPAEIGRAIAHHGVTTLWLTAGLFHQMVECHIEELRGVRQLLAGGDVLAVPHARKLVHEFRDCRLINGYGPTECTTFSCCCPVDGHAFAAPSLPIGRPIANTRAYILDAAGAPVPAGVQGELWIGGDGFARGYLNRPELTAEKFLPDPFAGYGSPILDSDPANSTATSHEPRAASHEPRMYRTGDMARYLPDGNIEFLGRLDNQVKIRGFRIELDEITAAMLEHPGISACATVAQGSGPDDKRIAAYITVRNTSHLTTVELREFLKQRLPEYMVPALFWQLDALPLTSNGKVDHSALSCRRGERLPSGVAYAAPRTSMEHTVAAVSQEVLAMDRVGLDENFFDLGGDSLRLTQMHWKLQQATGVKFGIVMLFQFPTVNAFAKYLHAHLASAGAAPHAPQVEKQGITEQSAGPGTADDRAAMRKAAMARWKQVAKGCRKHG